MHAALVLQSDTGTLGSSADGIRRWTISRDGSDADLKFSFINNDTADGKSSVSDYVLMQADGFNNNLEFPSSFSDGTKLIWQDDTNLYRSSADTLKTDDSLVVDGTVSINSTLNLSSGSITDTSGSISFGNENLSTTGTLGAAATTVTGNTDSVQLQVTGNSTQTSNILAIEKSDSTNLLTLSNAGALNLNGTMVSSGLMTMNVSAASITDANNLTTKEYVDNAAQGLNPLAAVEVVENSSNLTLSGEQTIDGVLTSNSRVLLNAQTDATENGLWVTAAGAWSRPADFAAGSTIVAGTSVFVTSGTVYSNSTWVLTEGAGGTVDVTDVAFTIFSQPGTITASNVGAASGEVFKQKTGNDLEFRTLDPGTHMTITTNASTVGISTDATDANTAGTIVARDGSGDFSAGTITATNLAGTLTTAAQPNITSLGTLTSLTMGGDINLDSNDITNGNEISATTFNGALNGTASGNLPLSGGTLTGDLQIPAGSTASPSLKFTGSTSTGLSASSDNLSFSTGGSERMEISSGGTVSVNAFTTAGVVHNDASGNLSSSQIVNSDIAAGANISDTKLDTISTSGKVANSATTATTSNTPNTIVLRDGSGDFSAGTATLSGLSLTGPLVTSSIQFVTPTAGGSTTISSSTSVLIFNIPSGNVNGQTITMPSSPSNGQLLTMVAGPSDLRNLTFAGGTIVNAPSNLNGSEGRAAQFVYNSSNTSWYVTARS